jgi:predicted CoA-substrate-specific enzyme activase
MLSAGIDIGSSSAKAVIMDEGYIVAYSLIPTGAHSATAASRAMELVLEKSKLSMNDIAFTVSTGYGRVNVPFAQKNITEISCHARGVNWFFPQVRTVLDMGGQDCKAIKCDEAGRVMNFALNDKCAAGTGRYLERLSKYTGLSLDEIGPRSLKTVNGPVAVDSFCAVFAENDVLLRIREGYQINDILAGAVDAIVERIVTIIQRIGAEAELSISGGIAKNTGIVSRVEKRLGMNALIADEPQIIGAVGAALFARDQALKAVS